jgi:molybdopterin converting factor small subunit
VITIHLHRTHRQHTDGLETVQVEGATVGECLESLIHTYPAMRDALFEGTKLRNTIEIYLNLESTYPEELRKATKDGDEIHVTVLLAGG